MSTRVPLSEAALRLGLNYHQVREKLLRGELPGGRDEFGRFYVALDLAPATATETTPSTPVLQRADLDA